MIEPRRICLWLLRQAMLVAFNLARLRAGNNNAARIAIIAITTNNSIRVNPPWNSARLPDEFLVFIYATLKGCYRLCSPFASIQQVLSFHFVQGGSAAKSNALPGQ